MHDETIVRSRADARLLARFWSKVEKSDGCWIWTGAGLRYGLIRVYRRDWLAHRFSWMLAHGPIAAGLCVCHRCDVTKCVRPDHLFLGTQQDNLADCRAKGRAKPPRWDKGASRRVKLTDDMVREMRALWPATPQAEIARQFDVGLTTASNVIRRRSWKHVE